MSSPEVTPSPTPSPSRRLSELRSAQTVDSTLANLLSVLRAELDLCAQLPVFEYEAVTEGHDDCASLLRTLAASERNNVEKLLGTLQRLLDVRTAGASPS